MQDHSTRTPSFPTNLQDYAPWVAFHGLLAPYGKCQCGCGADAPISTFTTLDKGRVKGKPVRFLRSHWHNKATLEEALWEFLAPGESNECWEWQKKLTAWRYGVVWFRGQKFMAHRVSYELHIGPIPDGLDCLHKCDNPPCCNPNHLFLGTDVDNVADKVSKLRHAYGERAPGAKLQESDVVEIRKLSGLGIPNLEIARRYRVTGSAIGSLLRGETWRRVP